MNAPEPITTPPNAVAVASLPVADIVASLSNPRKRFDDTYIAELAESIKAHGLIQPITVRPLSLDALFAWNKCNPIGAGHPTYEIVVGECRWRAAKQAGLAEIPAFWRELDDKQVLEIQVIENLQRRDVHQMEEAEGYQALIAKHGYTADQIAAKIGKSRSYVYGRLKYIALDYDVRNDFLAGKLEASIALLIARIPGAALQKKAAKEVINGYNGDPLSYRAAQQHIRSRYTLSLKQATFKPDDATLLAKAGSCTDCPKLSGNFQDLFNDITDPDVCTDPDCFEAKRQARRDQLIVNAEKKKIPVFLGDQGRIELAGDVEYVSIDAEIDDDAEGRTYRDVLGDKAPVTALIEYPYGLRTLAECAPLNTLEAALKKAGWQPAEPEPVTQRPGETPEQLAARQKAVEEGELRRAQENRRAELAENEATLRKATLDTCTARLRTLHIDTNKTTEDLLYLLAEAWLRQIVGSNELSDIEDDIREHIDASYTLPDEFDDADEIPRLIALLRAAPLANVIAYMLTDTVRNDETHVHAWNLHDDRSYQSAPHILAQITRLVDVPFVSLTHPAATPTQAAQAHDDSATAKPKPAKKPAAKKAKAKADPAPASPANEAATPLNPVPAWPFPTEVGA